jgi:hypothetical protein
MALIGLTGLPTLAAANGFLPTMITSGVVWLLVLPLVVVTEAWFLRRWGWQDAAWTAVCANLLSTVAALPLGLALSGLGAWLVPLGGGGPLREVGLSAEATSVVGQVLLYGQAPAPSFGFVGGPSTVAATLLATLGFMAVCGLFTVVVEGLYLRRKNPSLGRRALVRQVVRMHLASYGLLAALWLPAAWFGAREAERQAVGTCSRADSWSGACPQVLRLFPDAAAARAADCAQRGAPAERCLQGPSR